MHNIMVVEFFSLCRRLNDFFVLRALLCFFNCVNYTGVFTESDEISGPSGLRQYPMLYCLSPRHIEHIFCVIPFPILPISVFYTIDLYATWTQ